MEFLFFFFRTQPQDRIRRETIRQDETKAAVEAASERFRRGKRIEDRTRATQGAHETVRGA